VLKPAQAVAVADATRACVAELAWNDMSHAADAAVAGELVLLPWLPRQPGRRTGRQHLPRSEPAVEQTRHDVTVHGTDGARTLARRGCARLTEARKFDAAAHWPELSSKLAPPGGGGWWRLNP
jgi:hypothetical protein